ncbi:DNA polymerase III subunit alpha [compost metagenome]
MYALGLNDFDPTQHGLVPERLLTQAPNIHIDVEYERGQEFVDFCRETTAKLQYGQIQAFKMPLLDIMNNVDARLGKAIQYREIPDDSPEILSLFRKGDIEKIFSFDYSPDALIMKWENFIPGYEGSAKMAEYLRNQKIVNFRDIVNITALWRPNTPGMLERIERYRLAKEQPFVHKVLAPELQNSLANNFGVIIYHEDILRIIAHYTGWNLERCNLVRRILSNKDKREKNVDYHELKKAVPSDVFDLLMEENQYGFCEPHAIAFSYFTKATAVLRAFHHDIYLEEIAKWEDRNGFRWDDIGVNWKGVSIHQN